MPLGGLESRPAVVQRAWPPALHASPPRQPPAVPSPQLRRSTVVGAGGESVVDTYRTSYGMFIK